VAYVLPTIGGFKAQFVRDFPYATPLNPSGVTNASASASINDAGSVTAIAVDTAGSGYGTTAPGVVIYGGGGLGATATASLTAGAVSTIAVTNAGYGYQTAPYVYLAVGDNTNTEKVTDWDIARGITTATQFNLNAGLFSSQAAFTYAYNLLAAHYLCETVIAGGTGLFGKDDWLTRAKSVGDVSQTFDIPKRVLNSPFLAKLSKTTYGAQFLELVSPQLIANMAPFHRYTLP